MPQRRSTLSFAECLFLEASGWSDVEVASTDEPYVVAEKELGTYAVKLGPVAQAMREVDQETRARVIDVVRGAYAPWVRAGEARFDAACWLVRARA